MGYITGSLLIPLNQPSDHINHSTPLILWLYVLMTNYCITNWGVHIAENPTQLHQNQCINPMNQSWITWWVGSPNAKLMYNVHPNTTRFWPPNSAIKFQAALAQREWELDIKEAGLGVLHLSWGWGWYEQCDLHTPHGDLATIYRSLTINHMGIFLCIELM